MDFRTAVLIVSVLWLASEIFLALVRRARSTDTRLDRSSMRIIWIVIAISIGLGMFFGSQRFGRLGAGSFVFQLIGLVFMVFGVVVRWVAILTLKRQFTVDVAITEHHRLVTHGLYRYLRHPSYSGSLLSFFGLGLVYANYLSIIVVFVPVCWAFLRRIAIEERALVDKFGAEYLDYCSSTKRLIPFVY